MADQSAERAVIRTFFAFVLLCALSLAGFLTGKNLDADSGSVPATVAIDITTPRTVAPTTTELIAGVRVVGTIASTSMADPIVGLDLLRPGDCFNLVGGPSGLVASAVVSSTPTSVPCNEEHHYQIYWQGQLAPEVTSFVEVEGAAYSLCSWQFPGFVGVTLDATQFVFWYTYPDEAEWPGVQDISCTLALRDEGSWRGSGEGAMW